MRKGHTEILLEQGAEIIFIIPERPCCCFGRDILDVMLVDEALYRAPELSPAFIVSGFFNGRKLFEQTADRRARHNSRRQIRQEDRPGRAELLLPSDKRE